MASPVDDPAFRGGSGPGPDCRAGWHDGPSADAARFALGILTFHRAQCVWVYVAADSGSGSGPPQLSQDEGNLEEKGKRGMPDPIALSALLASGGGGIGRQVSDHLWRQEMIRTQGPAEFSEDRRLQLSGESLPLRSNSLGSYAVHANGTSCWRCLLPRVSRRVMPDHVYLFADVSVTLPLDAVPCAVEGWEQPCLPAPVSSLGPTTGTLESELLHRHGRPRVGGHRPPIHRESADPMTRNVIRSYRYRAYPRRAEEACLDDVLRLHREL